MLFCWMPRGTFLNYTVAHFSVDFSSVFIIFQRLLLLLLLFLLLLPLPLIFFLLPELVVQRPNLSSEKYLRNSTLYIVENWFAPESRPLKLTVSRRWHASFLALLLLPFASLLSLFNLFVLPSQIEHGHMFKMKEKNKNKTRGVQLIAFLFCVFITVLYSMSMMTLGPYSIFIHYLRPC